MKNHVNNCWWYIVLGTSLVLFLRMEISLANSSPTSSEQALEHGRKEGEIEIDRLTGEMRLRNADLWNRYETKSLPAIQFFAKRGFGNMVVLGLVHPDDRVKAEAASCLKVLGDNQYVPQLIRSLKESNVAGIGGAEPVLPRLAFQRVIIDTLANLTNQDFENALAQLTKKSVKDYAQHKEDAKQINGVIEKCEAWLAQQKEGPKK